jgi:hypothetical protein
MRTVVPTIKQMWDTYSDCVEDKIEIEANYKENPSKENRLELDLVLEEEKIYEAYFAMLN